MLARISGAEKHVTDFNNYRMLLRLPFLLAGLALGASLWYVARRLYGKLGGYVALWASTASRRLTIGAPDRSARLSSAPGEPLASSLPASRLRTRCTPRAKSFCGTGGAFC